MSSNQIRHSTKWVMHRLISAAPVVFELGLRSRELRRYLNDHGLRIYRPNEIRKDKYLLFSASRIRVAGAPHEIYLCLSHELVQITYSVFIESKIQGQLIQPRGFTRLNGAESISSCTLLSRAARRGTKSATEGIASRGEVAAFSLCCPVGCVHRACTFGRRDTDLFAAWIGRYHCFVNKAGHISS